MSRQGNISARQGNRRCAAVIPEPIAALNAPLRVTELEAMGPGRTIGSIDQPDSGPDVHLTGLAMRAPLLCSMFRHALALGILRLRGHPSLNRPRLWRCTSTVRSQSIRYLKRTDAIRHQQVLTSRPHCERKYAQRSGKLWVPSRASSGFPISEASA